jgi:hypothetical protein
LKSGYSDDDSLDLKLDNLKTKIEKSVARAQKLRIEKLQQGSSKKLKIFKALENKHLQNLEDDRKAQEILGNLNQTLEHSRVNPKQQKRKDLLNETSEKIAGKLSARFEKFKTDISKEEEKLNFKVKEVEDKDKERERVRLFMKNWYVQQGQLISEINRLRKKDQSENLNKNQANLNEFKLKILFKHLKKEKALKEIEKNKSKLEKVRNNTLAQLHNKKEKDTQDLQTAIAVLHKKN